MPWDQTQKRSRALKGRHNHPHLPIGRKIGKATTYGRAFGIMRGTQDHEVLVEFDTWATDMMRGRVWHDGQVVAPRVSAGAGWVRVSCLDEVARWVVKRGDLRVARREKENGWRGRT